MSDEFTAELKQFIAQHVESLAQLESILLLRQEPQQEWDHAALAQKLFIAPDMAEGLLRDLHQRGFVERRGDGPSYRFRPASSEIDRLLGELATVYTQRRVAVITEIYSKPVNKVQTFADAFRLRREE